MSKKDKKIKVLKLELKKLKAEIKKLRSHSRKKKENNGPRLRTIEKQ